MWCVRAFVIPLVAAMAAAVEPAPRETFDFAVELVRGADPDMRAVALEQLRDGIPGEAYTVELAERVLPTLSPEGQARLLATLAGRRDAAALPGVVKSLGSADPGVAAAAARAVAALGGGEQVPLLVGRLADAGGVRDAAQEALAAIQGPDVADRLVAAAGDAGLPAGSRVAVFAILAQRRERAAVPLLLEAAVANDAVLRVAAMRALAKVAAPADVGGMVAGFLAAGDGRERSDAERALLAVCVQGPEAKGAAAALFDAYRAADPAAQEKLLPLLARVGGPDVLAIVDALVADPDPARRGLGITALTRWPDAAVTDRLFALLDTTSDDTERRLLLGGLIRIAPLPDNGLTDAAKLALLEKTLPRCTGHDDRRRLLERAGAVRTVEALRFIVPHLDDPAVAESAGKGVVELAHHRALRDGHKAEFAAALDRVLEVVKDPVTRDRAERYKQGKTWERR